MRPRLKNRYRSSQGDLKSSYRYFRDFDTPGEDNCQGYPYQQWFYDIKVITETWVIQVVREYDSAVHREDTLTGLSERIETD